MAEPVLVVHQLSYTYPGGVQALNKVSFQVHPLEHVALVGPNGAGKSTLIHHLNGILVGDGDVVVRGAKLGRKTLKEIRRHVGIVFQDPDDQLFCPTLEEDVAFGPRNFGTTGAELERRITEALEMMELTHLRHRAPFQMSFGERKRAALATVLACQPHILVLDEPSSNLDPRHRRRLVDWLGRYEGTVVIATHDLDLALETTARCLILVQGRLVADGQSNVILRDKKLLEEHGLELPLRLQRWE